VRGIRIDRYDMIAEMQFLEEVCKMFLDSLPTVKCSVWRLKNCVLGVVASLLLNGIRRSTCFRISQAPGNVRAANATSPRRRIGAVVASRESDTVVLRVRCARLRFRGFCPIDKSTILWDATQPECILLQAGGVNEISVCATGEKQSGKRQPCKGN
jgi:hypothetical protein